jgi:hypothetical protein
VRLLHRIRSRVVRTPFIVALFLALSVASPAAAAPGMEVALQDDYVFVHQVNFSRERGLQEAQRLGVTRLRVNVPWAKVLQKSSARRAPATRVYDWSIYDSLIADAARYGIKLQMTVAGPAPAFATRDHRIGFRQVDPLAYGRFVRDLAVHFKGQVDRYSVWNEANWHTLLIPSAGCRKNHWGRGCDAKLGTLYRALYQAGYKAVKAVDPRAQVLIGEFSPLATGPRKDPTRFASAPLAILRAVTCSKPNWKPARKCAPLLADGFAQHTYAFTSAPSKAVGTKDDVTIASLSRLTRALDLLARHRALRTPSGRRMELYLTEHGYFRSGTRKLPEATRARYLTQSFDRALKNPRVRELLQYMLVAPPKRLDVFPTQIVGSDGKPTPSFDALERWSTLHAPRLAAAATPAA